MSQQQKTQPTVGLWSCVASAVGLVVASSAVVSLLNGFGIGGGGFIFAIAIAFVVNMFVAFSFGELSAMIPRAGGINHYTLPTLGPFVGIVAVISGYVLVNMFAGSAEAHIAGVTINEVFAPALPPVLISIVFVAFFGVMNLFGINTYSLLQIVFTTFLIVSLLALGLIGLSGNGQAQAISLPAEFNPMGWGVIGLASLAFWLFIGIEFVCPLAEEIRRPQLLIPLSMILGLLIIFVVDVIFGFAALRYIPADKLASGSAPQVLVAEALLGGWGRFWMGLMVICATASTINTLICAISRMLGSMGQNGQLPSVFGHLNRWGMPWVSVAFMTVIILSFVTVGSDSVLTLILAGAFCWMLTYIVAHLNVIILRVKAPHAHRPFRSPFGVSCQVLGIVALLIMMVQIHPDPQIRHDIYVYALGFLAMVVVFAALWVKLVMKCGLFETTPLGQLNDTGTRSESAPPNAAGRSVDV